MIICSCNVITEKTIKTMVRNLLKEDPTRVLTPGIIYRAIGHKAECGSCLSSIIELIIDQASHPSDGECKIIQLYEQREKLKSTVLKRTSSIKAN